MLFEIDVITLFLFQFFYLKSSFTNALIILSGGGLQNS